MNVEGIYSNEDKGYEYLIVLWQEYFLGKNKEYKLIYRDFSNIAEIDKAIILTLDSLLTLPEAIRLKNTLNITDFNKLLCSLKMDFFEKILLSNEYITKKEYAFARYVTSILNVLEKNKNFI